MRYMGSAAVAALAVLVPSLMAQGGLSITNYQVVSQTSSSVTYRADLVNSGPALGTVTATLTSLDPFTIRTVPNQDTLTFVKAPANGKVTSTNTFTILTNPQIPLDTSKLQWAFQTTPAGPIANPGPNQTVRVGTLVTLNGSGSSNPSGMGTLTYNWTFASRPSGTLATLATTSVMPTFVADVLGTWVITLTVSNGTASDSASVIVSTSNTPPVANAGPNQTLPLGSIAVLNGGGSTSGTGNPLTYAWTLISRPAGSTAVLSGANTVSPTFVLDKAGAYMAQLVVNDGLSSNPSTVTITTQTTPPVANAGPNQTVNVNSLVQLNGAGSTDANGLPLTYQWSLTTLPASSAAALSNPTAVNPTFTADRPGAYVAQLIVNNGTFNSTPSTVTITTNQVLAPTANAGVNQTVAQNGTVTLNGSGTDPQNLPLTFQWALINKPAGSSASLSSAVIAHPTLVADLPGSYVAQLTVNNGFLNSAPSTVTISTACGQPTANAGSNQNVSTGATVTLDASASGDVCHDPLTFAWSFTTRPANSSATLSGANTATPSFVADVAGIYVAQVIVNNGVTNSNPVTVTITAATGAAGIGFFPDTLSLTNVPRPLAVSMSMVAGPGGQAITLTSSNPAVATVPTSVTIPPGAMNTTITVTPGTTSGSTSITATAPGLGSATATVNVLLPTLTVALDTNIVGLSNTVNGHVTLSVPAGANTAVTLSATPGGIVSVQPLSVPIAAGGTTGNFTITGLAVGSAAISASAPGYTASSPETVTVGGLGAIILPANVVVPPNQSVPFPVTLATGAPEGGVTVTLTSSDPSKATITPGSVFIPFKATAPAVQPQVNGISTGSATITASAPNFKGDSQLVQVSLQPTISLSPASTAAAPNTTFNLTVNLSAPAPAGGLIVGLNSSNTLAATVPPAVTVPENTSSLSFPVTTGTQGAATITASATGYISGSATVNLGGFGVITLPPNVTLGPNQSASFPVTLVTGAPVGGVTVTLISSDPSKVTITPGSVFIPFKEKTPATQPQVNGINFGSATITASAPGFTGDSQLVQVAGTISFSPPNLIAVGSTSNLTLNLSSPAPAGGVTVNLSSSNPGAATVPATVIIAANTSSVLVPVTGVAQGSATITASAANLASAAASVSIVNFGQIILPGNVTLLPGQSKAFPVTLPGLAPAGGVTVLLISSDPTKVTIAPQSVFIQQGATTPATQPQVTGVNIGSANITASAPGFSTATQPVTVSATLAFTPASLIENALATTNLTLTLSTAAPPGGLIVNVSSDNTAVATVPATVTFAAGATSANVPVTGVAGGSTTIHASALPVLTDTTASVTIQSLGALSLPTNVTVTTGQSVIFPVALSTAAPVGGVTITLASSNTSKVTIAPATVFVAQGATVPATQPQVTGIGIGSATISASAPGWTPAASLVTVASLGTISLPANVMLAAGQATAFQVTLSTLAPPGGVTVALASSDPSKVTVSPASVFIAQGATTPVTPPQVTGIGAGSAAITASASGWTPASQVVQVTSLIINFSPATLTINGIATQNLTLNLSAPAPAGGLIINLSSSNPGVATVPATVSFAANATTVTVPVSGLAPGSTTITAGAPGITNTTALVTVVSDILLPANVTVAPGQSAPFPVTLTKPAPSGGVFIALASSDPSKVTVSPTNIFIPQGQTAPNASPTVTGIGIGAATVTASAFGLSPASGQVQVSSGAAMSFSPGTLTINAGATQNLTLNLSAPAPAGLTATLNSSNTGVATVPATVTFTTGATSAIVPVTGVSTGSATITAATPAFGNASANVTVSSAPSGILVPANVTVPLGQSAPFPVTLGAAAPLGGVFIALTSSDPSKVTVSPANIFVPQGQTAPNAPPTVTGVNAGSASITASAFGYTPASGQVQVTTGATMSFSPGALTVVAGTTANLTLNLSAPAMAAGTITLSSSNTGVATVPATLNFGANATSVTVPVTGVAVGSVTITASTPNFGGATANVTVSSAPSGILVPATVTVAPNQTASFPVTLGTAAPAGGVFIALLSSDTSKVTVSPTNIFILQGMTAPSSPPTVTGVSLGSATITASASGFTPASGQVQVGSGGIPPAVILPSFQAVGIRNSVDLPLSLSTPAPAGGVTVTLLSNDPSKLTVSPSVFIAGGATSPSIQPLITGGDSIDSEGFSTVTAAAPGFTPAHLDIHVSDEGTINIPRLTIGLGQTVALPVALPGRAPAGGVNLTAISSNPSIVTVTPAAFVPGGSNLAAPAPMVTGVNLGLTTIDVSASGFTSGFQGIEVTAALTFSPAAVSVTGTAPLNLTLNLSGPAPAGGLTINLGSNNTAVATVPSSVNFTPGATSVIVPVTGTGLGLATITAAVANMPGVPATTASVTRQ